MQSGGTLELHGLYFSLQDASVASSDSDGNGAQVNGDINPARISNLMLATDATLRSLSGGLNVMPGPVVR